MIQADSCLHEGKELWALMCLFRLILASQPMANASWCKQDLTRRPSGKQSKIYADEFRKSQQGRRSTRHCENIFKLSGMRLDVAALSMSLTSRHHVSSFHCTLRQPHQQAANYTLEVTLCENLTSNAIKHKPPSRADSSVCCRGHDHNEAPVNLPSTKRWPALEAVKAKLGGSTGYHLYKT